MTGTDLCVNMSQFVAVIFEPPCKYIILLCRLCICVHEQIRKYNYVAVQIMYLCT
jgi:hypothetical protein